MQVVWGTFFFFFFLFSKQRKCSFSAILWPIWLGKKKEKKKDKNDSEQNYLPVSPRCCCCSPRCLGHLAGVGVSARPQLHFPCLSRCSGHRAKASSVPMLGTTAPCTPAPRSAGTSAPGCFVLCHPPAPFCCPLFTCSWL